MPEFKRISDIEYEKKGFVIHVDEEWMEMKADIKAGATKEALQAFFESRKIVHGVDWPLVMELLAKAAGGEPVNGEVIGRGTKRRPGHDGKLEFLISMEAKKVEVEDESGNVDFRDLNLIRQVHRGDKVLKLVPPDEGEEGVTLLGRKLAVEKGQKGRVLLGKNVEMAGDYVVATLDGHVEYEDPLVSVLEEYVVHKDVDFTIGNLDFIGSLVIEGNVREGFSLKSEKNITVKGLASKCDLTANGNIIVEQGIHGSAKNKIHCQGHLTTRFLNDGNVFAQGGITVFKEIVRSTIRTMGKLDIENGDIRGGDIKAYEGIIAKEIGSPLGTPTIVTVGENILVDGKVAQLKKASENMIPDLEKLQKAIEPFMKNKLLLVKADDQKKKAVESIIMRIEDIRKKQKLFEAKIQELEGARYSRDKTIVLRAGLVQDGMVCLGKKKKEFKQMGKMRSGTICYDKTSFEIVFSR